jgi:S-formylglutathione hydrolase
VHVPSEGSVSSQENRGAVAVIVQCALIEAGARLPALLVDQGLADKFLAEQLHIDHLEAVCKAAGQPLTLRRHAGYDHGYFFVSTFIEDHLRRHRAQI